MFCECKFGPTLYYHSPDKDICVHCGKFSEEDYKHWLRHFKYGDELREIERKIELLKARRDKIMKECAVSKKEFGKVK